MEVELHASVITGFESVGRHEVEKKLGCKCAQKRGFIRFQLPLDRIPEVLKLRSIDNVYAVVFEEAVERLREMSKEDGLATIQKLLPAINWAVAVDCWQVAHGRTIHGGSDLVKDQMREFVTDARFHPMNENSPKFRVTCNRAGEKSVHSFSSMDAARAFGAQMNNVFGWRPNMKNYDMEIVLNVREDFVLVMISLNAETMFKRNVCAYGPTTMRSTMCYCMLALAQPKDGDLIVDPMCGGGSIPLEGALAYPGTIFMGGDNHPLALERCAQNMENNKGSLQPGQLTFSTWDATQLPFNDGAVSHIVTDLPFGRKIGSTGDNRILYPKLLREWYRVTKCGSRLVVMTHDRRSLENSLPLMTDLWSVHSTHMVNVGGLTTLCMTLKNMKKDG